MSFVFFLLYLTLTYVRPYELYPQLAPLRLMLVVGGAGLLVTLATIPMSGFSFKAKQLPLVLAFALWAAFTLVLSLRWFGGALDALNGFAITLVSFVLAVFSLTTELRLRITLTMIVLLSLFLVLMDFLAFHYGIFRDILILEQVLDSTTGAVALRARATGFMTDPNDLAQGFLTAIPFVALAWRARSPFRNFFLAILPMIALLYGVYLTGSRGAVISIMVMLFIVIRPKLGNIGSSVLVILAVLGVLAISFGGRQLGTDESVVGRLEAWSQGIQLLKQHPLTGVGYGMFTDYNPITAHNSFVLCFSELGLPGYFLWIALLLITVLELNAIRKLPAETDSDRSLQRIARSIQIALYSFLVSAWFLSRTYIATLYLLIALAIAVVELYRRAGKTVGPFPFLPLIPRTIACMIASILIVYLQVRIQVR